MLFHKVWSMLFHTVRFSFSKCILKKHYPKKILLNDAISSRSPDPHSVCKSRDDHLSPLTRLSASTPLGGAASTTNTPPAGGGVETSAKYGQGGSDTLSDFVTIVCQETLRAQQQQQQQQQQAQLVISVASSLFNVD